MVEEGSEQHRENEKHNTTISFLSAPSCSLHQIYKELFYYLSIYEPRNVPLKKIDNFKFGGKY